MSAVHSPSKLNSQFAEDAGNVLQQQRLALPVIHQDSSTFTLVVDSEFFEANPSLSLNPFNWTEETNIKVWG